MKSRHSQKCFLPSDVSGLDLTISVSQNVTNFHTKYNDFGGCGKHFYRYVRLNC